MLRLIVSLSIFLLASGLSAAPVQVDATTAATMNNTCKITSLTSASNSFTVNWTEKYRDGTMVLKYGFSDPPTTTKVVTAFERTARSITISGLQPATKYFVLLTATKSGETSYGANSSITTAGSTAVTNTNQKSQNYFSITRNKNGITISGVGGSIQSTNIKLYNTRGELVSSKEISQSRENGQIFLKSGNITPGSYFLRINSGNKSIGQQLLVN